MKEFYYVFLCLLSLGTTPSLYAQSDPQLQWVFNAVNASIQGGSTDGRSIAVDAAGNRYVTGYFMRTADFDPSAATANLTSVANSQDIFIAKYDVNGNYLWAKAVSGYGNDVGLAIAVDGSGQVHIAGRFQNTADFDPSASTAYLSAWVGQDIFIAKYDTNGNYLWAKALAGSANEQANAIVLDGSGQVHIAGNFQGFVDFDPLAPLVYLTSAGSQDAFIAKYDANGNYLWAIALGGTTVEDASAIALDSSGQVHITGYFQGTVDFDPSAATVNLASNGANPDIFIAKYDPNGNYLWAKAVGGTGSDFAGAIALDNSGQVHISGGFSGTTDFNPSAATANLTSAGSEDVFIAKYDTNGNYLWAKSIGGTNAERGYAIAVNGSGQVHISGGFSGTADFDPSAATANLTSAGSQDIFIAQYNASGNYLWAKAVGSTGVDYALAIALNSSGQVDFTGFFNNTADFDPSAGIMNLTAGAGNNNCYVAGYTSAGNYTNAFAIGGYSAQGNNEEAKSVVTDTQGNVYISGSFRDTADFDPSAAVANLTSVGSQDIFIAKYDTNGNYLWAKSIGGTTIDDVNDIAVDSNGQVYITGYFQSTADFDPSAATSNLISVGGQDIFIAKYDTNGNYLWAKALGGINPDIANAIALDGSGQIYITGYFYGTPDFDPSVATANLSSVGEFDFFIAKYDVNGNYLWAKSIGGIYGDEAKDIALDSSGQVHIIGRFQNTVDFDPSAATVNLTAVGTEDHFIAKYDANGNYLWAKAIGGTTGSEAVDSIVLDASGQVYITGYFSGTVDFDPSATTMNLISNSGGPDIFIAKYDTNGNYLWAKAVGGNNAEAATTITLDSIGQVHIAGYFQSTVDLDPSATTMNFTSVGGQDIFIAKYTSNGDYLWAKTFGGPSGDAPNSIALNSSGQVYVAGLFMETADFEPLNAIGSLTSVNSQDLFLAKYSECNADTSVTVAGNVLTANATAGAYQWIDCANGNAFVPGATNQSFTPAVDGNYAVILTDGTCERTSACQAVLSLETETMDFVRLYPNPTTSTVVIHLPYVFSTTEVVVTDMLGTTLKKLRFSQQQELSLSFEGAAAGIYFVQLQSEEKTKVFKVIKK